MPRKTSWAAPMAMASLTIALLQVGCTNRNTTEHLQLDAETVEQDILIATARTNHETAETASDVKAKTLFAPPIVEALLSDKELGNEHNRIRVEMRDGTVHLYGHVTTEALKTRATQIAQNELTQMQTMTRLSNDLEVHP